MPKMSDLGNSGLRELQGFPVDGQSMRRVCVGSCGTTCLTEMNFRTGQVGDQDRLVWTFAGLERLPLVPFFSLSPAYISMSRTTLMLFKGVFGRCLTLGVGTKGASSRKVSVRAPHEMTGSLPGQPPFRRWILRLKYSDRDQPERVCQKMEIRNDDSWQ